jgi:hypothetical protein
MINKELFETASEFRAAILSIPKSEFPWRTSMGAKVSQFPNGCCGDASQLLLAYFHDKLGVKPIYILGENGGVNSEIVSHAWLEVGHLVIDITADQFNESGYNFDGVYVGERTDWYRTFDIKVDLYNKNLSVDLIKAYARICREL